MISMYKGAIVNKFPNLVQRSRCTTWQFNEWMDETQWTSSKRHSSALWRLISSIFDSHPLVFFFPSSLHYCRCVTDSSANPCIKTVILSLCTKNVSFSLNSSSIPTGKGIKTRWTSQSLKPHTEGTGSVFPVRSLPAHQRRVL